MIRIGLLGAGRIGQIHGRNAAAHRDAKLVAVADAVPEAAATLAKVTGAAAMSADALIADKRIEAVLICTSTDTHADFIVRAARAGKAIFCEKPIDLSAKRIVETLRKTDEAGAKLMIGFNRRFDPHFSALRKRLSAGAIGEVGEDTRGALRILEQAGLRYLNQIDPFDGGPYYGCAVNEIVPVRSCSSYRASAGPPPGGAARFLIARQDARGYRALVSTAEMRKGQIILAPRIFEILKIHEGDQVDCVPLDA